jgi:5-methylcytosine-specific restriction endonuclease McrA
MGDIASVAQLMEKLELQGRRCALTGRPLTLESVSIDHVVPVSNGGDSSVDNLELVAMEVNTAKGTLSRKAFVELCVDVACHCAGG